MEGQRWSGPEVTLAQGESPEQVLGASIQRQIARKKRKEMYFSGVLMYDNVLYHTLKSGEVAPIQAPAGAETGAIIDDN